MEFHEREFFVSKICAGYLRYQIKPELTIIIKFPNGDIKYKSQEKYNQTYENAVMDGVFNDNDIRQFLEDYNIWNPDLEEYLTDTKKGLLHQIEILKVQLYEAAFKPTDQVKIRKYLNVAKKEFVRLNNLRHQYDYITCHGLATYARWYYIIQNCTYYEDGNQYDWSKTSVQQTMTYFQINNVSDEVCRLLAHTEPWSSKWSAMKFTGNVFNVSGVNMTDEQIRLLAWTGLYDNISESLNSPPKLVIDEDDMLDGWLILERQNREKDQSEKRNEDIINKNPKISNADEIFIMAETQEDAQNINQLNTNQSTMIKNMRLKQVTKEGTVSHKDFNDVKMSQAMKANQAYIQKMKEK